MRNLTIPEIDKILEKHPQAKRIAVENFLITVTNCGSESNARKNLKLDTKLYRWNTQTVKAIKVGIEIAKKGVVSE